MMTQTLKTHAMAFGLSVVMVAGLLAVSAVAADSIADNKTVTTTKTTQHESVKAKHVETKPKTTKQGATAFGTESNDNIAPAAGDKDSSAPRSNNTYGTTGSNLREDIKQGR